MTRLEKTLFNAIEDCATNTKIDLGIAEENKGYAIKRTNKTLALYLGNDKVVVVDNNIYTALAVKMFAEYIKF